MFVLDQAALKVCLDADHKVAELMIVSDRATGKATGKVGARVREGDRCSAVGDRSIRCRNSAPAVSAVDADMNAGPVSSRTAWRVSGIDRGDLRERHDQRSEKQLSHRIAPPFSKYV